jgi:hypothetical protein
VQFMSGKWVWLRLLHRPLASLDIKGKGKLGPKFFGPFKVLDRVGNVAFQLELPTGAKLHNVFHVGLLKPFWGEPPSVPGVLPPIRHGRACIEPMTVEKSRITRGKLEVLVQWKGLAAAEASWMPLEEFRKLYTSKRCGKQSAAAAQEQNAEMIGNSPRAGGN